MYVTTSDSGYRNLILGVGKGWANMPDINVKWARDGLINTITKRPPVFILGLYHIDLLPVENGDGIIVRCREEPELKRLVNSMAPELDKKLRDLQRFFATHPLSNEALRLLADKNPATQGNKKLFTQLKFALAYETESRSAHNLVWQLIKVVLHPRMRWLWVVPGIFKMENQVDRLEEYRLKGNPHGPLIWHISNTIQTLLVTVDMVVFGIPRDYRFTAKKYGINDEGLIALGHKLHPRMFDEYNFRKAKSVIVADIALRACGQHKMHYWIYSTLKTATVSKTHPQGKLDDVADVICEIYDHFNSCTRTTPYNTKERERIVERLKEIDEKKHEDTIIFVDDGEDAYDDEVDAVLEAKREKKKWQQVDPNKKVATSKAKKAAAAASAASATSAGALDIGDFMVRKSKPPARSPTVMTKALQEDLDAMADMPPEEFERPPEDFGFSDHDEEFERALRLSALEAKEREEEAEMARLDNIPVPIAPASPVKPTTGGFDSTKAEAIAARKRKYEQYKRDNASQDEEEEAGQSINGKRIKLTPKKKKVNIPNAMIVLSDDDDEVDDPIPWQDDASANKKPKKAKAAPAAKGKKQQKKNGYAKAKRADSYFTKGAGAFGGVGGDDRDTSTRGEWYQTNTPRYKSSSASSYPRHKQGRTADDMMQD